MVFYAGSELHAATGPFLCSNETEFAVNNKTLAEIMVRYWISFAVKRDPNAMAYMGAPVWQSCESLFFLFTLQFDYEPQ